MQRNRAKETVWAGGCAAGSLTVLYLSLFFNRFAGVRSGDGEFAGGDALVHGRLPFRDYFTASPPLNQFKAGLLLELFGDKLIVLRAAGTIERGLIAVVVYLWIVRLRLLRPAQAVAVAFATLVISSADNADPIASYNHDALFAAIISGYLISFVLDRTSSSLAQAWFAAAAGVAASLSFLAKQTVGVGALGITPLVAAAVVWHLDGGKRALKAAAAFVGGAAIPASLLIGWLASLGQVKRFWLANFVQGPAAKAQGGGGYFFTRALYLSSAHFSRRSALGDVLGAVVLSYLLFLALRRRASDSNSRGYRELAFVIVGAVLALALGAWASYTHFHYPHPRWIDNYILMLAIESIGIVAFAVWVFFAHNMSERQAQLLLFAATSISNALMLSLSYPFFAALLLPGFALLFMGALAGTRGWWRVVVYACVIVLCADAVRFKFDLPFGFGQFDDGNVFTAMAKSDQPELAGMRLPPKTVRFLDETTAIIAKNTTPSDRIFSYPEMSLLYTLTDRTYPTQSGSHNIDVVNDVMARAEAERLLAHPPKVLIFMPETEQYMRGEEMIWRHGNRAGQRDIRAAVETLARNYDVAGVYPTFPNNPPIGVYVRRSPELPQ